MGRSSDQLFRALISRRAALLRQCLDPRAPGMAYKPCSGAIRCTGRACKVRKSQASTPVG